MALVTYTDENGYQQTQLAVVGDSKVHLLNPRSTGFTQNSTTQGPASPWLRDGIFKKLGR